jgi:hypothetical protein
MISDKVTWPMKTQRETLQNAKTGNRFLRFAKPDEGASRGSFSILEVRVPLF